MVHLESSVVLMCFFQQVMISAVVQRVGSQLLSQLLNLPRMYLKNIKKKKE